MSAGKCPGCGCDFRKGATVLLLEAVPRRARVCPRCEARALRVVAPLLAPVTKVAVTRPDEVQRAIAQLTTLAKAAEASGLGQPSGSVAAQFQSGRAEAYRGAIELLKGGRA